MDLSDRLKKLEGDLAEKQARAQEELHARLSKIDRGIGKRVGGYGEGRENRGAPVKTPSPEAAGEGVAGQVDSPADAAGGRMNLVHSEEKAGLWVPRGDEIEQAMEFVRHSPHISGNQLYRARAEGTRFFFLSEDMTVNAFATDSDLETQGGEVLRGPKVVFLGGLANALCLTATALALQRQLETQLPSGAVNAGEASRSPVKHVIAMMGEVIVRSEASFHTEHAERIYRECLEPRAGTLEASGDESFIELARSFRASMYMFVIAHEFGHLAYGHTLGHGLSYEVSRRQEFDADSFAVQALSTSAYSQYHFLGQLFVTIIFAWMEHAARVKVASTHPLGRDRFRELFRDPENRAAKQVAEEFGLTREKLEELLPARAE